MSSGIDSSCHAYPWAATAACKMQKPSPTQILADAEANYKKIMTDMSQMVQNYIANNQERFWGSLLNMDQQIKSGDMTLATGSVDANSMAFYTECSKSEKKTITLTHAFESVKFIPIAGTPFKLLKHKGVYNANEAINAYPLRGALIQDMSGSGYTNWRNANLQGGEVVYAGTFDEQGMAIVTIPACEAGYYYVLAVSPDIDGSVLSTLIQAYQSFVDKGVNWLTTKWTTSLHAEWIDFANSGEVDGTEVMMHVLTGIWEQLHMLYSTLKKVWDWVSNGNLVELGKYFSAEGLAQFKTMFDAGSKELADTLTLLSDEVLLYIIVNTLYSYIILLTPQQISNALGEAFGQMLIMVMLYMALPGGLAKQLLDQLDALSGVIGSSS